jgi:dTDP-4-amino-4,6-dideoxygalactose transaminase
VQLIGSDYGNAKSITYIIEDNAQTIGANVNFLMEPRKAGTIGHVASTSFSI